MTDHKIGTREEWLAARNELLAKEKELTRMSGELARQRRGLPWVPVEKEYMLQTEDGTSTLAELFDGRSQLVVYHFMFGPDYEAGCPACSSTADSFDGVLAHLKARDVTMICVSRAPLDKLLAYRERMGWSFPWASSFDSDFNFASGTDVDGYFSEGHGVSTFAREGGTVYHCYSSYARGTEFLMGYYAILDRAPKGRDEGDQPMSWLRRHDEYGSH